MIAILAWPLVVLALGSIALRMAWLLLGERQEMRRAVERYSKALGTFRDEVATAAKELSGAAQAKDLVELKDRIDKLELETRLKGGM